MAFEFDTGWTQPDTPAQSAAIDDTQRVKFTSVAKARTVFNKIKANIEMQECPDALDAYWDREDLILDALHLFDPRVMAELTEIYTEHRACLIHGGATRSAQAAPHRTVSGNPNAHDGNTTKEDKDEFRF